ncbi:MAG: 50S ribosomal protein L25 [Candidatus Firestonebacteria bacterium]
MEQLELKAKVREEKGKNAANRLRFKNEIPGIFYGGQENTLLILSVKDIQKIISTKGGENILINLKIEGKEDKIAIIKEIQVHPVSGGLLHVDLYQVSLVEEITVNVPIKIFGNSPGVKLGGILEHHLRELKIKCLPAKIPSDIPFDISNLNIGDSVHVKDLKIPLEIKVLENLEEVVITCGAPKEEEVKPEGAIEEAPTGPEVIGEKEREEKKAATEKLKEEKTKEKQEAKTKKE